MRPLSVSILIARIGKEDIELIAADQLCIPKPYKFQQEALDSSSAHQLDLETSDSSFEWPLGIHMELLRLYIAQYLE